MSLTYRPTLNRDAVKFEAKQEKAIQERIRQSLLGLTVRPPAGYIKPLITVTFINLRRHLPSPPVTHGHDLITVALPRASEFQLHLKCHRLNIIRALDGFCFKIYDKLLGGNIVFR